FFDTLIVFENYPISQEIDKDWSLKMTNVTVEEHTNYLLTVVAYLLDTLHVKLSYNRDLLDSAHVRRIQSHFKLVLEQLVSGDKLLSDIQLLPTQQELRQLEQFNATRAFYEREASLVDLFERQVAARPASPALHFQGQYLSYAQLNQQANQLAHYLRAQGIQAGHRVGLCLPRAPQMVIALLAVLKTGACYLPLDPTYPPQRLRYLLEDAAVQAVLSQQDYWPAQLTPTAPLLWLEQLHEPVSEQPTTNPGLAIDPARVAYILYTSGTTGQPKGILVSHGNVAKLALEEKVIGVEPTDRVLQWSNLVFDGSVYDLFGSLLNGACLHLISQEQARDVSQLATLIPAEGISVSFLTTALFNNLVDYDVQALRGMRRVLFGGQQVSVPHVARALAAVGPRVLVHVYGPTETTVFATCHLINEVREGRVPIGAPLSNTQVHIVNSSGQLAGVNVVGELWIGGEGVAAGYLNRPALTRQQFVSGGALGERLYRTGDLGRWLADGSIDFVGRRDEQVKVRGYRIELEEVTHVLQQAPGVSQAAVVAVADAAGDKRLVGYVVGAAGCDSQQVRAYLAERLPEYMVPALLVALAQFPLTPNGKIDRKALPDPSFEDLLDTSYVAPRNSIEQQLAEIWASMLGLDKVGIHDNFFDLGGNSLLVTRLVSAIKKTLGIEVSIKAIFNHATIAELAAGLRLVTNQVEELNEDVEVFEL
ncbi:MAG TPA: amino acid adenylation domain-containing protein, partial [Hymenobacter sp.]|nr:amino acid adenylation domain-containing protein [Hymenobacter sp.]